MAGLSTGAPIVQVYHEKSMILPDVSRVLACLYEKDVKFETHTASYKSLLRLQALTHAPVPFYDGPTFLEESREICRYIAETYEHHGYPFLLGSNGLERASIEQWLHHEEHDFNPPSRSLFCHLAFPLDDEDEDDEINLQKRKLEEVLEVYDQRLSDSEFLAGNNFTLADLVHLPNSHYITASDKFVYLYDSRKNVQRWWNAISTRDSWQKVLSYIKQVEQRSTLEEIQKQQQQQFEAETSREEDTCVSAADQTETPQTISRQQPTPPAPITRRVPDAQHVMRKPQEDTPDILAIDSVTPLAPSQQEVSQAPPTIPGQKEMTPAPPTIPAQAPYFEAPRDSAPTQHEPSDALRKTELAKPTSIDQEGKEPTAGPAPALSPQHVDTLRVEATHVEQEFVPSDQESVSAAQPLPSHEPRKEDTSVSAADQTETPQIISRQQPTPPAPITRRVPDAQHVMRKPQEDTPDILATDSVTPLAPSQQEVSQAPLIIPGQKEMTPAPPTIPAQVTYFEAPRDSAPTQHEPSDALRKTELGEPTSIDQEGKEPTAGPAPALSPQHADTLRVEATHVEQEFIPSDQESVSAAQPLPSHEPTKEDTSVSAADQTETPQTISRQQPTPPAPITRRVPDAQHVMRKPQEDTPDILATDSVTPLAPSQQEVSQAPPTIPGQKEMTPAPPTIPAQATYFEAPRDSAPTQHEPSDSLRKRELAEPTSIDQEGKEPTAGPAPALSPQHADTLRAEAAHAEQEFVPSDQESVKAAKPLPSHEPTKEDTSVSAADQTETPQTISRQQPTPPAPITRTVPDAQHVMRKPKEGTPDILGTDSVTPLAPSQQEVSQAPATIPGKKEMTPAPPTITAQATYFEAPRDSAPTQHEPSNALRKTELAEPTSIDQEGKEPTAGPAPALSPQHADTLRAEAAHVEQEFVPSDQETVSAAQPLPSHEPRKEDTSVSAADQTETPQTISRQQPTSPAPITREVPDAQHVIRKPQKDTPDILATDSATRLAPSQQEVSQAPPAIPGQKDMKPAPPTIPGQATYFEPPRDSAPTQHEPSDALRKTELAEPTSIDQEGKEPTTGPAPALSPQHADTLRAEAAHAELEFVPSDQESVSTAQPLPSDEPRKKDTSVSAADQTETPQTVSRQQPTPLAPITREVPDAQHVMRKPQEDTRDILATDSVTPLAPSQQEVSQAPLTIPGQKEMTPVPPTIPAQATYFEAPRDSAPTQHEPSDALRKTELVEPTPIDQEGKEPTAGPAPALSPQHADTLRVEVAHAEQEFVPSDQETVSAAQPLPSHEPRKEDTSVSAADQTETPQTISRQQPTPPAPITREVPDAQHVIRKPQKDTPDILATDSATRLAPSQQEVSQAPPAIPGQKDMTPAPPTIPGQATYFEPPRDSASTQDVPSDALRKTELAEPTSIDQEGKEPTTGPAPALSPQHADTLRAEAAHAELEFVPSDQESVSTAQPLPSDEPRKKDTSVSAADQTETPQTVSRQQPTPPAPITREVPDAQHVMRKPQEDTRDILATDSVTPLAPSQQEVSQAPRTIPGQKEMTPVPPTIPAQATYFEAPRDSAPTQHEPSDALRKTELAEPTLIDQEGKEPTAGPASALSPRHANTLRAEAAHAEEEFVPSDQESVSDAQPLPPYEPRKEDTSVSAADQTETPQSISRQQPTPPAPITREVPDAQHVMRKPQKDTPDILATDSATRLAPSQQEVSQAPPAIPGQKDMTPAPPTIPGQATYFEPPRDSASTQDVPSDALRKTELAEPTSIDQEGKEPTTGPAPALSPQHAVTLRAEAAHAELDFVPSDQESVSTAQPLPSHEPRKEDTSVSAADQTETPQTVSRQQPTPPAPITREVPDAQHVMRKPQKDTADILATDSATPLAPSQQEVSQAPPTIPGQKDMTPAPPTIPAQATYFEAPRDSASTQDVPSDALRKAELADPTSIDQEGKEPTAGPALALSPQHADTLRAEATLVEQEFVPSESVSAAHPLPSHEPRNEDTSVSAADQTETPQTISRQQPLPPAPISREVPDAQHVMRKPQKDTPDILATDSATPLAPSQQEVSQAPPTIPGQKDMTPAPPIIPAQGTYFEAPRDSASTQDVPSDALRKTELAEPTLIDQEGKEPTAGPASALSPRHANTLRAEAAHAEQEFVPSDQESVSAAQPLPPYEPRKEDTSLSAAGQTETPQTISRQQPTTPAPITREVPDAQLVMRKPQEDTSDILAPDLATPLAPIQQEVSQVPPTIPGQKDMTLAPATIPAQATYFEAPRDSASTQDVPSDALRKTELAEPTSTDQEGKEPTAGPASALSPQHADTLQAEAAHAELEFVPSDQESVSAAQPLPSHEPRKEDTSVSAVDQTETPQAISRQQPTPPAPITREVPDAQHVIRKPQKDTPDILANDSATPLAPSQQEVSQVPPTIPGQKYMTLAPPTIPAQATYFEAPRDSASTQDVPSDVLRKTELAEPTSIDQEGKEPTAGPASALSAQHVDTLRAEAAHAEQEFVPSDKESVSAAQPLPSHEPRKEDTSVSAADQTETPQTISREQPTPPAPITREVANAQHVMRKLQEDTPDILATDSATPIAPSQQEVSQASLTIPGQKDMTPAPPTIPAQATYFEAPRDSAPTQDVPSDALRKTELVEPTSIDQEGKEPTAGPALALSPQHADTLRAEPAHVEQEFVPSDQESVSAAQPLPSHERRKEDTSVSAADQTETPQTISRQQPTPPAPITREVPDAQHVMRKPQEDTSDILALDSATPLAPSQQQVSHARSTIPGEKDMTPAPGTGDPPTSETQLVSAKSQETTPDIRADELTLPFVSSGKQGSHVGSATEPHEGPSRGAYGAVVDKETNKSPSRQAEALEARPDSTPTHGFVRPTSGDEPANLPDQGAQSPAAGQATYFVAPRDSASTQDVPAPQGTSPDQDSTHTALLPPSVESSKQVSNVAKADQTHVSEASAGPDAIESTAGTGPVQPPHEVVSPYSRKNFEGTSTEEKSKQQQKTDQSNTQSSKDDNIEANGTVSSNILTTSGDIQPSPPKERMEATEESRKQQQAEQAVFQSTQGNKKQVEDTEAQDTGANEPEETNLHENTNQKNNGTSQGEALDQSGKQASGVQLLSKNTNNGSESTKDASSGIQTDNKYENSLRTSEETKQQIQTEGKIHGGETEQSASKTEQPKERDLPANSGRSINSQSQAEASDKSKEQSS